MVELDIVMWVPIAGLVLFSGRSFRYRHVLGLEEVLKRAVTMRKGVEERLRTAFELLGEG